MVEATVGVAATSLPVTQALPLNISSLTLATLSPSEVAEQVAEQATTAERAAPEAPPS